MRKSFFPGTMGIFALFFVPYIVTIIFNGANTTLINKKFNVEMLLPVIVSSQIEDKKRICIKDTDSKKDRTVLRPDDKKNNRKNKIIYWNEPRIQNRINRAVYFNTG